MAYGKKVLDHYENPRNVGVLDKDANNVGTGMVGAPACGDVMRLQIQGNDDDTTFDDKGVKVIVDAKSLIYIDGTEVDYQKEGLNEGFEFNNPNSKAECGCGESFTV